MSRRARLVPRRGFDPRSAHSHQPVGSTMEDITMETREVNALRAFAQVWADTAYFKPNYHRERDARREAAATVVAPLLDTDVDGVLARMWSIGKPPYFVSERASWVSRTVEALAPEEVLV